LSIQFDEIASRGLPCNLQRVVLWQAQRVGEVDRDMQVALTMGKQIPQPQKVVRACDDDRQRVDVCALNGLEHMLQGFWRLPQSAALLHQREVEECPRTAGRIQQRTIRVWLQQLLNNLVREPIRRVVLAQIVARDGVNQLLVERLEHILGQAAEIVVGQEAQQGAHRLETRLLRFGARQPREKVVLDISQNAFPLKQLTRHQVEQLLTGVEWLMRFQPSPRHEFGKCG
jgi:hypothetical protein